MATTTTNLGLIKPAGSDKIRIAQINGNMDILDEKLGPVGNTSLQTQITNDLQVKQKYISTTVTGNINSVATLNSALENGTMNTMAIDASYRPTLVSAGLIPVNAAGIWTVRKLSSNYMFLDYVTYNEHSYFAVINNGVLSGWNELALESDIMYAAGDSITMNYSIVCHGYITDASKQLVFYVPLEKVMIGDRGFSFTTLKLVARGIDGYVDIFDNSQPEAVGRSGYSISVDTRRTGGMQVRVSKTSALTNATNNTPVSVLATFTGAVT